MRNASSKKSLRERPPVSSASPRRMEKSPSICTRRAELSMEMPPFDRETI
nr:hypothetical protein [uncultured Oscillibacter sp.]